ncbi:unnamed protein product [Protopolystoma xenopodis]|uniref:Reticulocalbin-3 n=1 Tax=Protopolystoma xenopodis TaxID=117903 RepID=A0A448XCD3_9PLAT|nr:unnamed protein product [Protopolystoma xenopodis]
MKKIVKLIDTNGDGMVTKDELKKWISEVAVKVRENEAKQQWAHVNREESLEIDWEVYSLNAFGPEEVTETFLNKARAEDTENIKQYLKVIRRDKRRWEAADLDGNGRLNREEFSDFVRAEDRPHMLDALVEETVESMDNDGDGQISLDEYIADVARSLGEQNGNESNNDWQKRFREEYTSYRDKNKDGHLDKDEIKDWIWPKGYDPIEAEAQHLMFYADSDKDEKLTVEEVIDKYDLFVGSQATNYGRSLEKEEL